MCRKKVKVKLADGKERSIQHMMATTFWSPDGKPISAAQFIERLFGELPELFKDEDELRLLWGRPDTRKALLEGLAEKGFGEEQLVEAKLMIDAENSDIFDVLAYIAFTLAPISRKERVEMHRENIFTKYNYRQQEFLGFVLNQYVKEGVGELAQEKLPTLLEVKYNVLSDAAASLGSIPEIREVFIGFQQYLYEAKNPMGVQVL